MDEEETSVCQIVINYEEQYSIWLATDPPPEGWRPVGPKGPKAECLAYIQKVWTDMRPASLRREMDG